MWTIDFALCDKEEAALYEVPFEYRKKHVYPIRSKIAVQLMLKNGGNTLKLVQVCEKH